MSETHRVEMATALHAGKPLSIVVTHEGSEFVKLRKLAIEAVPMLLRPETFLPAQREQIAQGFRQLLAGNDFESEMESDFCETESFAEENAGYEPGECLDFPQWEDI